MTKKKNICVVHPHNVNMDEVAGIIEANGDHPIDIDLSQWPTQRSQLRACDIFLIDEVAPVSPAEREDLVNVEEYCCEIAEGKGDGHVSVLVRDGVTIVPICPTKANVFTVHHESESLARHLENLSS